MLVSIIIATLPYLVMLHLFHSYLYFTYKTILMTLLLFITGSSSLLLETQHPEGLQKIQYLEDASRYRKDITEDVKVTSGPVFITPLSGPTKLVEGNSSHLECRIEPYPDPTMKIEWFFNGKPLPSGKVTYADIYVCV